jgi:hypothetical protein
VTVSAASSLPSGWTATDIGAVGAAGRSSAANGVFTINGAGADIWGTADALQYAYRTLSGDGELTARVVSVQNTARWAKAGVMIRASGSAGAAQATMLVSAGAGSAFQYRSATNGVSASIAGPSTVFAPEWVRIVRAGSDISGYESADGVTWTLVGKTTIPFGATVDIGFAVSSHNTAVTCTATFDHVS